MESPLQVEIPGGDGRHIAVASLPAFFAMKAVALSERLPLKRPKDAYDIVYCLRNYPGGIPAVVREFERVGDNALVLNGINLLSQLFESVYSIGPEAYAARTADAAEAALLAREAYERVADLLKALAQTK